jgi:predicted GNAT family acetyltransferase
VRRLSIFHHKPQTPQKVTSGRFEIERDGAIAYLEYSLSPTILELQHTEIPAILRGKGIASELAEGGLQYAREHRLKVDPICTSVQAYLAKHPEYSDLVLR